MKKPRIVAVGGGTGLYTLLRGLAEYDLHLTAIVTMTDDGGSTGQLRDEYGILPPGDVRRCIVALSESPELMKELFQYRFRKGPVAGHSFGNLFIAALRQLTGSDERAIDEAARLLNVRGRVLPVTLDSRRLVATLEDGSVITGETNIDLPKHDGRLRIESVKLNRPARVNPRAARAIEQADLVVLGPGDLYTSILPNLLIRGIREAIARTKARVVYVCNLMTKFGETNGYWVHDFVDVIEQHLAHGVIDYVVTSSSRPTKKTLRAYAKHRSEPVRFDRATVADHPARFVRAPLAARGDLMRHDAKRLARTIWGLVQLDNEIRILE